jgi:nitrile hydratase
MARFKPGDQVRVKMEDRPGHIRTPFYVRGKTGWVEKVHGDFLNPELLAYGRDGLPKQTLYSIGFDQPEVWGEYHAPAQDKVYVDIYDHWLEPV